MGRSKLIRHQRERRCGAQMARPTKLTLLTAQRETDYDFQVVNETMTEAGREDAKMSLRDIILEKVTEADLISLISAGVPESPVIDYKQETYGDAEKDRREFLADISSFANTIGGDVVIGVAEFEGLPTS
ncbi:MAG: ATP-binding protein, partial [Methylocystis silviterrae]